MHKQTQIEIAKSYINRQTPMKPEVGIILGSGLSDLLLFDLVDLCIIPYEDIPFFNSSTIKGHKNQVIMGNLYGKQIVIMNGRCHYYEGYSFDQVTFSIRVMKSLGVKTLIITSASGAINDTYKPGDLMLVKDHINLTGLNPLIGPNDPSLGPRALDLSNLYNHSLRSLVKNSAKRKGILVHEGVYFYSTGPTFETPAEIRAFKLLGADAVGASICPEALIGSHSGLKVVAVTCLSNMAAGITNKAISHEDVLVITKKSKRHLNTLLLALLQQDDFYKYL